MSRITYHKVTDKLWIKQIFREQCPETVLFRLQCQGAIAHKGEHWCYREDGSYCWEDNKSDPESFHDKLKDPRLRGVAGMTTPGSKDYIAPIEKRPDYFMKESTIEDITDPEVIARLEADLLPVGEDDASINRPCTLADLKLENDDKSND